MASVQESTMKSGKESAMAATGSTKFKATNRSRITAGGKKGKLISIPYPLSHHILLYFISNRLKITYLPIYYHR